MLFLKRRKIKLSLIDDYIKIMIIKKIFHRSTLSLNFTSPQLEIFEKNKKLNEYLENIYLSLFSKLKLNDLSLLILKKELNSDTSFAIKEENSSVENISKFYYEIEKILKNLKEKVKILKINLKKDKIFTKN